MTLDDWRELEELTDIARNEILNGSSSDEGATAEEISIVHEVTMAEARRVIKLIETANVTVSWDD